MRSRETDVEVFGGEVESLTTAGIEGIGVRVVADHRQGYAWAGSLDADVVDGDAARGARQRRVRRARRVVRARVARRRRTVSRRPTLDLWRDELASVPTDEKVRIALDLERATKAADPRIRNVESASYGDALTEAALANSLGVEAAHAAHDVLRVRRSRSPTTAPGRRRATGSSRAARLPTSISTRSRATRRRARAACSARSPIPVRRIPVILDPLVTRSVLGVLVERVQRRVGAEGPFAVRGPGRRADRRPARELLDDPTDPRALGASEFDSEGVPTRRNTLDRRRRAARLPAQRLHRPPFGRGHDGQRGARLHVDAGRRRARVAPRAGRALARGDHARRVPEALYVQSVSGLHSGTNPISGDFSVGAEGLMVRGGAFAEPVREVTIASTLQRMLLDIAEIGSRPHVPARRGRGHDRARRRDDAQRRLNG